ncbi:MAG: radical SAM protein, partial [Nanoarchaeota archaeon]
MAGWLHEAKFESVKIVEDADIVIFHTCTAQGVPGSFVESRIEEIRKEYPYKIVILAGCMAKTQPDKWKKFPYLGSRQFHHIVEAVEERLHNNVVHFMEDEELPPLVGPKIRKNHLREIIPIMRSCVVGCAFCKNKRSLSIQSYPQEDIVQAARKAVEEGVREIVLTGHDTLSYGIDRGISLPILLQELIAIPGRFKIRVGMSSPAALPSIKKGLIPILRHDKMFQCLHLTIPTGSTTMLREMKENYSTADVLSFLQEARVVIPELQVVMDLAVGFPLETEEHYWETMEFVKKCVPDTANIVPFAPLPKTDFASLEGLPQDVLQHRVTMLQNIVQNTSVIQNERWQGWEGPVIIEERGRERRMWIGRTTAYKPVVVEGD